MFHLQKCEYCRGKDGKQKDIYVSFQLAFDTAKFVEEVRGIFLNVYKCPYGNGWHLTKNNASFEILERKETLFQNNDIPLDSPDGSWEYIRDGLDENNELIESEFDNIIIDKKECQQKPIIKIEFKKENEKKVLIGKVMEIIENINIEKIFNINTQNIFCANLIKNILDGIINQITIYSENEENGQLESYTILLKKELLKNNKIKKGNIIKLNLLGKTINKINRWYCDKIF
jgi:hypothetical protein